MSCISCLLSLGCPPAEWTKDVSFSDPTVTRTWGSTPGAPCRKSDPSRHRTVSLAMAALPGQANSENAATEAPPASEDADVLASPPKLCPNILRRVRRSEDSAPIPVPGLAPDILHMRVKEGSKIRNLLRLASARMQGEGRGHSGAVPLRQVLFTGSDRGVTKTITCVEILKRRVVGLHQVSKLYYKTVTEVWEGSQQGAAAITVQRTVPAISILLSKDLLDPREPGYQPPPATSGQQEEVETCRTRPSKRPHHGDGARCSP